MNGVEALLVAVLVTWFVYEVVERIIWVQVREYAQVQKREIKSGNYVFLTKKYIERVDMQEVSKRHREWWRKWKRQNNFWWKVARVYIIFVTYTPELRKVLTQYEIRLTWLTRIWRVTTGVTFIAQIVVGIAVLLFFALRGQQWADKIEILIDQNIQLVVILFAPIMSYVFYGCIVSSNYISKFEILPLPAIVFANSIVAVLIGLAMYQMGKDTYCQKLSQS